MRRFPLVPLVCVLVIASTPNALWAQQGETDILRNQILELQEKLNQLEKSKAGGARRPQTVTEIGTTGRRTRQSDKVISVYDLGDLFAVAPAYPVEVGPALGQPPRGLFSEGNGAAMSSGGGFGGGGFFRVGSLEASGAGGRRQFNQQGFGAGDTKTSIDDLAETIKRTISPESWDTAGGDFTIAKLGNAYIIAADATSHEQIGLLLDQFRQRWGTLRTVSVRAHWLFLNDAEIAGLVAQPAPGKVPFGAVKQEAWVALLKKLADGEERRIRYQAMLTCYNGQTVHTLSGQQAVTIADVEPVLTPEEGEKSSRIAYRLTPAVIHDGIALQVTPVTNLTGKIVLLDVHSQVSKLNPALKELKEVLRGAGADPFPQDVADVIDRSRASVHSLATTLRVPVDQPFLVGGMSLIEDAGDAQLYLFVEISVQELRDDKAPPANVEPAEAPAADVPAPKDE